MCNIFCLILCCNNAILTAISNLYVNYMNVYVGIYFHQHGDLAHDMPKITIFHCMHEWIFILMKYVSRGSPEKCMNGRKNYCTLLYHGRVLCAVIHGHMINLSVDIEDQVGVCRKKMGNWSHQLDKIDVGKDTHEVVFMRCDG